MTMHRDLQQAYDALEQSAGGIGLDQLIARPHGKWTIAEILEHLGLAFAITVAGAERVLSSGRPAARHTDLASRLRAFVVVECGYLPTGRPSPKMVMPVGIDAATALPVALRNLRQMDAALTEAAKRFGESLKLMDHPVVGALSVRQWRRFHWVHTRHHVRQIRTRVAARA